MRVVIESKCFSEARFRDFADLLGEGLERATGVLVHFWFESQEKLLINATEKQALACLSGTTERRAQIFKLLLEAGYIEAREDRYRIKGNEDRVAARSRRIEKAKKAANKSVQSRKKRPASSSELTRSQLGANSKLAVALKDPKPGQVFIATYCEAYKSRYGVNPIVTPKDGGICQRLLKAVPIEKARHLIQAYLQMEDRWFMTKCHDLVTFEQNLGKVAIALANGTKDPHEKDFWKHVFGGSDGSKSVQNTN